MAGRRNGCRHVHRAVCSRRQGYTYPSYMPQQASGRCSCLCTMASTRRCAGTSRTSTPCGTTTSCYARACGHGTQISSCGKRGAASRTWRHAYIARHCACACTPRIYPPTDPLQELAALQWMLPRVPELCCPVEHAEYVHARAKESQRSERARLGQRGPESRRRPQGESYALALQRLRDREEARLERRLEGLRVRLGRWEEAEERQRQRAQARAQAQAQARAQAQAEARAQAQARARARHASCGAP